MKLEDLQLRVSPLTDRIYLGTLSKKSPGVWGTKVDFMSKFLGCLMEWIPLGTTREFSDDKGNRYEVTVTKLPPEVPK
jgi:hypothetical protein